MTKRITYYLGFYRDYSIRDHPVICQATDNIDCLSCELLGGDYPLIEVYLPYQGMKKFAFALAVRHNAAFVEINGGKLQRISKNNYPQTPHFLQQPHKQKIMDYLCIGSNGFAQVGQQDFHLKNKAEMAVLMDYLETNFPIPEEFSGMCYYGVKWFKHDFGNYSEIVLIYDDQQV